MHVTTTQTQASPDRQIAPFATWVVLPITGVVAVLHCAAGAFGSGYWFDEVYMLAIGRNHLDWGSADQPPVTPLLAAVMDAIAPGSILALRVPAVLATAGAVVVAGLIARELGCDRRAQGFTAAAQATALWTTLAGHWLTPYTLEPVQWMLLIWLLVRWLRVRQDRLLLAFGVVAGVAALTKFQVLLLCAVLLLAVAAVGPRDLLRRPLLWVGAAIAGLVAAPTMLWQYANGWPQLHMGSVVVGEAEALYGGRPGIAVQLLIFAGVGLLALALYGLWRIFRDPALRDYRFLGVAFVVLYVFFVGIAGRPYYLAGWYAPLAAVGALAMQHRRESRATRDRWLVWPIAAASVAVALGTLVMSSRLVSDDVGPRIAQRTADAYRALPDAQRERTVLIGQSYIVAAYIDGYSDEYSLPKAFSVNRSYGYFPPPPADSDTAVFVGSGPDDFRPYFADVHKVGDVGEDMGVYLLTGQQESWDVLWSRLRTLEVA
jgi:hypothetical protein